MGQLVVKQRVSLKYQQNYKCIVIVEKKLRYHSKFSLITISMEP